MSRHRTASCLTLVALLLVAPACQTTNLGQFGRGEVSAMKAQCESGRVEVSGRTMKPEQFQLRSPESKVWMSGCFGPRELTQPAYDVRSFHKGDKFIVGAAAVAGGIAATFLVGGLILLWAFNAGPQ